MKRYQLVLIPLLSLFLLFGHHRHKKAYACPGVTYGGCSQAALSYDPSIAYNQIPTLFTLPVACYPSIAFTPTFYQTGFRQRNFVSVNGFTQVNSHNVQVNVTGGARVRVGIGGRVIVNSHR